MNDNPIEEAEEEQGEQEPVLVGDSSFHKFPYICKQCGNEWEMNYYDIMRLTDRHEMPCGHEWASLDFKRAVQDMMEINKV